MCFPRAFICGFNEIAHHRWKTANPDVKKQQIRTRHSEEERPVVGDTEQNPRRLIFGLTRQAQDHFLTSPGLFKITAYSTGICFHSQIFQIKLRKKMRHTANSERFIFELSRLPRSLFIPLPSSGHNWQDRVKRIFLGLKPSLSFHPSSLKGTFLLRVG